jgi:hypothetical protein
MSILAGDLMVFISPWSEHYYEHSLWEVARFGCYIDGKGDSYEDPPSKDIHPHKLCLLSRKS